MDPIRRLRDGGWLVLVALLALWVGTRVARQPAVTAGVRETTPKEHFLAGSERSLPVLREISTTLRQIDARLSRIEKAVMQATEAR